MWGVGASLALASAAALLSALPSGAQEEPPELAATVSPDPVEPGVEVTVSSADPCPRGPGSEPGWLTWRVEDAVGSPVVVETTLAGVQMPQVDPEGAVDGIPLPGVDNPVIVPDEDGAWTVFFDAPDVEGRYTFEGTCLQQDEERSASGLVTFSRTATYTERFDVATVPPARPVSEEPTFTG